MSQFSKQGKCVVISNLLYLSSWFWNMLEIAISQNDTVAWVWILFWLNGLIGIFVFKWQSAYFLQSWITFCAYQLMSNSFQKDLFSTFGIKLWVSWTVFLINTTICGHVLWHAHDGGNHISPGEAQQVPEGAGEGQPNRGWSVSGWDLDIDTTCFTI